MFFLCFHYAVEIYLVLLWNRRRYWIYQDYHNKLTLEKKAAALQYLSQNSIFHTCWSIFQYRFFLNQPNKHKVCNKKQAQQSEMKTNWKIEIISWKTSFNSVFFVQIKHKVHEKRESIYEKEVSWHKKPSFSKT